MTRNSKSLYVENRNLSWSGIGFRGPTTLGLIKTKSFSFPKIMTNNARVYNVTRRFSLKYKQALKAIENCACAWVEPGKTVRDLTLAESIAARNTQAKNREPLPFAEIPGIVFRFADQAATRQESQLVAQANRLVAEQAA